MFSGSLVALVTPFKNGKIDEKRLAELIEWHIRSGTHGIVPCGTTGESATLSHEEHTRVVKLVVESVKKRVPVIAGTGSNCTAEAIRLTREAQEVGADGALMISPYYNRPTQEGIYQHYKAVAEAVSGFPIIFYNIPSRTGSNIEPHTMARLAEIDNIVGVKEAAGSIDQVLNIFSTCGDRLAVLSGEDSLTFSMMSLGGKGVISTAANVVPQEMAELANACLTKQWDKAARLQLRLIPLIRALFIETNPIPVKTALALMGRCELELRLPLVPMAEANRIKLQSVLQEYGLLG
jgi:4-hydroxy-tetrahydrodipicolinate synthase